MFGDDRRDLLQSFERRGYLLSDAGQFEQQEERAQAEEQSKTTREAATSWRRSLGAGDTVPGHGDYDYEAMARDEVWPKPDGAGRVPLSPRYYKPGRLVLAGHDIATGKRVLSRVPLEERVMSGIEDDGADAENIEAILSQATPEDWAELTPAERRTLEAWTESQGMPVMVAQGGTQGTATDAPPVARVGRAGVPYQPPSMRDITEPATALLDSLAGALKGGVAQTLGLPGDLESLVRLLTGGEQVMPTTEDMEKNLPPVVPKSTTDLVTGTNPREASANFGQQVGEVVGLGKGPGMAAKGVAATARTLAPTAKEMARKGVEKFIDSTGGRMKAVPDGFEVTRTETWDDGTRVEFGASPFPMIPRRVELPTGRDASKQAEVRLDDLHSSQREITLNGLTKPRDDSHGLPLVVRSNGVLYIQDGHHRLASEKFAGKETAKVRLIDLDNGAEKK